MPSVSEKQQRFMRMVNALQSGAKVKSPTAKLKKAAATMKHSDVVEFADSKMDSKKKRRRHMADAMMM